MKNRNDEEEEREKEERQNRAKVFGEDLKGWLRANLRTAALAALFILSNTIGFFSWFYVTQARIDHDNILENLRELKKESEENDKRNEKKIDIMVELQQIMENYLAKQLAIAQANQDKKLVDQIQKQLDDIRQIKIKQR